ncbi:hypothetical protein DICVIV_11547 [Dictyocaulus viviparus]|uniref:Protein archease-like n=1 Tax=Dictyocaulus viviparus TaxID=29172 RepID=A0A0D8XCW8_DICVI|nr:hypothetical protein DICVIV_11547 [Dictyocaulus viviparus]
MNLGDEIGDRNHFQSPYSVGEIDLHLLAKRPRPSKNGDDEVSIAGPSMELEPTSALGYRYLEHPADIQVHAWGPNLTSAIEQAVVATYGYMTELESVEEQFSMVYSVEANDLQGLVHAILAEALCGFQSEPFFVGRRVVVDNLDLESWKASFEVFGECFDLDKHNQLSDVKAITYSNMHIVEDANRCDIFVILDI